MAVANFATRVGIESFGALSYTQRCRDGMVGGGQMVSFVAAAVVVVTGAKEVLLEAAFDNPTQVEIDSFSAESREEDRSSASA